MSPAAVEVANTKREEGTERVQKRRRGGEEEAPRTRLQLNCASIESTWVLALPRSSHYPLKLYLAPRGSQPLRYHTVCCVGWLSLPCFVYRPSRGVRAKSPGIAIRSSQEGPCSDLGSCLVLRFACAAPVAAPPLSACDTRTDVSPRLEHP